MISLQFAAGTCIILTSVLLCGGSETENKSKIAMDQFDMLEAFGSVVRSSDLKPIPSVLISRDALSLKMSAEGITDESGQFSIRFRSDYFSPEEREKRLYAASLVFSRKGYRPRTIDIPANDQLKHDLGQITLEEDPSLSIITCTLQATSYVDAFPAVNAIDFFPSGKALLTGSSTARLWSLSSPASIAVLLCEEDAVRAVAVFPDEQHAAIGYGEGDLKIWELSTGKVSMEEFAHIGGVRAVDVSPDGTKLITGGSDGKLRIWNAFTGTPARTIDLATDSSRYSINDCRFHPSAEKMIVAGSDGTVGIIDLQGTTDPGSLDVKAIRGRYEEHGAEVHKAVYSPDGRYFLTVTSDPENSVRLWNVASPTPLYMTTLDERVTTAVIANHDLDVVLGTRSGDIFLWKKGRADLQKLNIYKKVEICAMTSLVNKGKLAAAFNDGKVVVFSLDPLGLEVVEMSFSIGSSGNSESPGK